MNGESYRFRESMKQKKGRDSGTNQTTVPAQNGYFQEPGGSILDDQGESILDDQFHPSKWTILDVNLIQDHCSDQRGITRTEQSESPAFFTLG
jgi:hypothetical protein